MSTTRRSVIAGALGSGAAAAQQAAIKNAPISPKDNLKVTRLETFLVKPRWLFLKIHTNAGIVGWGEPITEGRALTCAEAVKEIEPYLVGKDPRRVAHHWQAIYRHAFYRGGPILTSALSGIDQALWDIKGKALGVPVYELLGGPTRDRIRVYSHANSPDAMKFRDFERFHKFFGLVRFYHEKPVWFFIIRSNFCQKFIDRNSRRSRQASRFFDAIFDFLGNFGGGFNAF